MTIKIRIKGKKVTSFKRMVSCVIKSLIYVCIYDTVHVSVCVFISSFKGNTILHLLFFTISLMTAIINEIHGIVWIIFS